jgi:predicted MFS family arabinose efflux permease
MIITATTMLNRSAMSVDARRVFAAQALRAVAYGFGAVLLGATLDARGFDAVEAGIVLAAVVAGTVAASLAVGRWGDWWGRRRCYLWLYLLLAFTGLVFAISAQPLLLAGVALFGALSTEVVESGPFTTLEQSMLATDLPPPTRIRGFSRYNAVAAAAGSAGALLATGPSAARRMWSGVPADQRFFLVFVPVALAGAWMASRLSVAVEADHREQPGRRVLVRSRPVVVRLAGLFALDSFAGGFAVQAFIAYWLSHRFGATITQIGLVFAAVGVLQTVSFLVAGRLAERFGLLRTMVFTHLPSNVLLAALAFAPSLAVAVALLLARTLLSQMDVPTRQTYVMALVDPDERTAAAATTNTARYVVRPIGPILAGAAVSLGLGVPFVVAGGLKSVYDVLLWRWFRHVPLPDGTDG